MTLLTQHRALLVTGVMLFAVNVHVLGLPAINAHQVDNNMECRYTTGGPCPDIICMNMNDPTFCTTTMELYNSYKAVAQPFRHCKKDTAMCCVTEENPNVKVCRVKFYYENFDCDSVLLNCTNYKMMGECAASYEESHPECEG